MRILIGFRTVRIKKIDDYSIKCENCGKYHQRFSVFQQYFHLMFIPIYPSGLKTIKCVCVECNDTLNHEKKKDYLSLVKTPVYLYSGVLLLAAFILFAVYAVIVAQKEKREFVNNPMVGDVYEIRQNEHGPTAYYFIKVKSIKHDTIEVLHGALEYTQFVSAMNNNDYFVKDDAWKLLKSDLTNYLDKGNISSAERDYELSSRFNIER